MKLIRYGQPGAESPGIIDASGNIRGLSGVIQDIAADALLDESLDRLRSLDLAALPKVEGNPRLGPCVGDVGKFIGIGLNYTDHAAEAGMLLPDAPVLFMKATSSIAGANDPVKIPPGSSKTDWEVELGVIIGKPGIHIEESDAWKHIAGYCVVNDISERAYQLEGTGQWVKGKSYDGFGPIGPWLVTRDEVADPQALEMWLDVNGIRRQHGSTSAMVFGVMQLVAYTSRFMRLHTGDLIATGTPSGVGLGQSPPVFLEPGDRMELGIKGLGMQTQRVAAYGNSGD